jgi:hypothetical protein
MKKWFAWIARNERHLSTVVFIGGFVLDNLAYPYASLDWINTLFMGFLVIAAVCIILNHLLHKDRADAAPSWRNPFYTLLPLIAQFFIGGLLSGCLILYARSATFGVSWPFLLILFAIFVGNEVLQKYRERLAFHTIQFFFTLYAYAVFALPVAEGKMGASIFLLSGAVSVAIFAFFLGILWLVGEKRLKESLRRILISCGVIFILVNVFYFTGILPPLPLALKDAGIYHAVVHTGIGYSVQAEESVWAPFSPEVVHYAPGSTLFAYSAVFAPISLTTPIVHRWQKYNDVTRAWDTLASTAFSITGGRDTGYRGYSSLAGITPGAWRVSIETLNGGVLGRIRFNVEEVQVEPTLHTELK